MWCNVTPCAISKSPHFFFHNVRLTNCFCTNNGKTVKELINNATLLLKNSFDNVKGGDAQQNFRLESQLLLSHALNVKREKLITLGDYCPTEEQVARFHSYITRRGRFEPVSFITGQKEFWSLPFQVNRHTLIPRPATESLVELCLPLLANKQRVRILDLGTGSGCILLSLLHECKDAVGVGVDISDEALEVARENCRILGLESRATFVNSNWLAKDVGSDFDLVVSNPPYISQIEFGHLEPTVKSYEPTTALLAGSDGLDAYKDIASSLASHPNILKHGGHLALEIGYNLAEQVRKVFENVYQDVQFVKMTKDMEGHNRCLHFFKE